MPRLAQPQVRKYVDEFRKELNVCKAGSMPMFYLRSRPEVMKVELCRIERRDG